MNSRILLSVLFTIMVLATACSDKAPAEPTEVTPTMYPITRGVVDEASGMVDSKANTGYLWVHQDSDTPPELALISYTGEFLKKIYIKNIWNRDWEDMAIAKGPDPSKDYIYLSDMGDNYYRWSSYFIYRFPEPAKTADTVFSYEKIEFKYPDGYHDAEAFIVDPSSNDIYIITKRDVKSRVYVLKYPYSQSSLNTVNYLYDLDYNDVVGAAMQADNRGVAVKTYQNIKYYPISPGEPISAVLKKAPSNLPYQGELQGESVAFTNDNKGYYTLSERRLFDVTLNYYRK